MKKEICKCEHHTDDHSYTHLDIYDDNLYCDLCKCQDFHLPYEQQVLASWIIWSLIVFTIGFFIGLFIGKLI